MNYSVLAFILLTATTLSSASAFNVPVFGNENEGNGAWGNGDFEADNEEGILNVGRNDCEQKQKEFDDSDGNTQAQTCEMIFNNLVDNENFNNIIDGNIPEPEPEPEPLTCEECFEEAPPSISNSITSFFGGSSIGLFCELFENGIINDSGELITLEDIKGILEADLGPDAQEDIDAFIECLTEAFA